MFSCETMNFDNASMLTVISMPEMNLIK